VLAPTAIVVARSWLPALLLGVVFAAEILAVLLVPDSILALVLLVLWIFD
jgi:hypothetical protein